MSKSKKAGQGVDFSTYGGFIGMKIVKAEPTPDGYLKVIGWASAVLPDSANEIVPTETVNKAINDYAKWDNIREMHNPFLGGAGTAKLLYVEDDGLWLEAVIVDTEVQQKILAGVYKGFSIGYGVRDFHYDSQGMKVLDEIRLIEISVVDRPMNKHAMMYFGENVKFDKSEGVKTMSLVLTLEDRAVMPDGSFAFVGKLDGKSVRIMPYKDTDGVINEQMTVAAINILNSNREPDIAAMSHEQRDLAYKVLSGALSEIQYKGDVPAFKVDINVPEKPVDYAELKQQVVDLGVEVKSLRSDQEGAFARITSRIKEFFTKAVEVNASSTTYDEERQLSELKSKLFNVPYILDNVLYNILVADELGAEEKSAKGMKAFNDARADWIDTFEAIAVIAGSKSEKPVETKKEEVKDVADKKIGGIVKEELEVKGDVIPSEATPEGKTEDAAAQVATDDATDDAIEEATEEVTVEAPAEKAETVDLKTAMAPLMDEIKKLGDRISVIEQMPGVPGHKFAEKADKGNGPKLDVKDPNFWLKA